MNDQSHNSDNYTPFKHMLKACILYIYQYFIFIVWEHLCQILYAADDCIMNFLPSCKTEPECNQTKNKFTWNSINIEGIT